MTLNQNKESTILVVDDNSVNLKILFEYLNQQNFEVLMAQNGEDAL